ncbi:hypothetical protein H2201_002214 [Coniosporium apollinis]|uniref:J domain-containing protein n=1 Tax=Coniosporium apollinis TaxID=61459 RepID=A0ABQ9NZ91_9PEZI|nr:hypothetical protein H2201_002214 [Coniosporium apollinis]
MVKADPKRNYYADLDLQPGADTEEIRKQFRKLALIYHPDRNPGRESECVPKFQAIQAAHEILGDPTERHKYDAERSRLNIYPNLARPNGPPRASYTANTNFPPPPRRTKPPETTPRRPTFTSTPSSAGASRFTNFPRPPPSARATREDAEAKANVFNAWQHLNPGKHAAGTGPGPGPGPGPPPQAGTGRYRSASDQEDQAEKGRTAWENFNTAKPGMGRSKTTRTPKKPGFDPTAEGDERQAGGASSYYTNSRYSDRPAPPPHVRPEVPPTPPRAAGAPPTARRPDPMDHFRDRLFDDVPFAEGNRDRTPYANSSGERTFLGRSASVRSSPHRPESSEVPDSFRPHRHRSASPSSRVRPDDQPFSPKSQAPPSFPSASSAHTRDRLSGNATKPFFMYSSSDEESDPAHRRGSAAPHPPETKPTPDQDRQYADQAYRPKATPAPSWAKQDHRSPAAAAYSAQNGTNGGTAAPTNGMGQKSQSNMYASPFTSGHFPSPVNSSPTHFPRMSMPWSKMWPFGSKKRAEEALTSPPRPPYWAIPSSVSPAKKKTNSAATAAASQQAAGYSSTSLPNHFNLLSPLLKTSVTPPGVLSRPSGLPMDTIFKSEFVPTSEALADAAGGFPSSPSECSGMANEYTTSFDFPPTDNTFSPTQTQNFKSRSHESVNTTFSPSDWDGKFTGAPDYFAQPPPTARKESRARVSPTRGRTQSRPVPVPPPPPRSTEDLNLKPGLRPPMNGAANSPYNVSSDSLPGGVKFSQEEWAKTFKEPSWVYPPPKAPSPTRPSSTGRRTKTPAARKASTSKPKSSSIPQPASVSDAVDDFEQPNRTTSRDAEELYTTASRDSNAMDIDTESPRPFISNSMPPPPPGPPPAHLSTSTSNTATAGPRLVPVQPTRPEWRDDSASMRDPKVSTTAFSPTEPSKDTVNLTDLKKVAPFTASASGLQSTDDLASSLPFESRPSPNHPSKSFTPKELPLPQPPKAPASPERLTQKSWADHLSQFSTYMIAWNKYNRIMLNHFDARQAAAEMLMSPVNPHHPMREGGGWLGAQGEGEKGGFKSYLQALTEDERVRMHWTVSCEKHKDAVQRLGALREKVRLKVLPVA